MYQFPGFHRVCQVLLICGHRSLSLWRCHPEEGLDQFDQMIMGHQRLFAFPLEWCSRRWNEEQLFQKWTPESIARHNIPNCSFLADLVRNVPPAGTYSMESSEICSQKKASKDSNQKSKQTSDCGKSGGGENAPHSSSSDSEMSLAEWLPSWKCKEVGFKWLRMNKGILTFSCGGSCGSFLEGDGTSSWSTSMEFCRSSCVLYQLSTNRCESIHLLFGWPSSCIDSVLTDSAGGHLSTDVPWPLV